MTDAAPPKPARKPRADKGVPRAKKVAEAAAPGTDLAVIDTKKAVTDPAEIDHKNNLPKSPDEIRLGETRMDYCSGFCGIVMARVEFLTGNVQFGLQPRGSGETILDCHSIDFHLLSKIDDGIADRLPPVDDTVKVRLGEEVEDIVSGVKGIAIEKTTFQNGCVYFAVQPPASKKTPNVLPEAVRYPHGRLTVIGRGLLPKPEKVVEPKPVKAEKKSPPGGPSRSMKSVRQA